MADPATAVAVLTAVAKAADAIVKVAKLFDDDDQLNKELDEILTHIDKLSELDTTSVEPVAQVLYEASDTATLREDIEHTPLGTDLALANAPMSGAGHFKVPRVIER